MSDPRTTDEAIAAVRAALLARMSAADAFSGIVVSDGAPAALGSESAWVSDAHSLKRVPAASNLTLGELTFNLGIGFSVAQMAGQDWSLVRARMVELASGFEHLIGPQFGGDPTLGGACMSAFLTAGEQTPTLDDASRVRLINIKEISVTVYA